MQNKVTGIDLIKLTKVSEALGKHRTYVTRKNTPMRVKKKIDELIALNQAWLDDISVTLVSSKVKVIDSLYYIRCILSYKDHEEEFAYVLTDKEALAQAEKSDDPDEALFNLIADHIDDKIEVWTDEIDIHLNTCTQCGHESGYGTCSYCLSKYIH